MIENELMSEGNGDGSFAVRLCNGDSYVLMIRQGGVIRSYKIIENEHGEFVFHAENRKFPALSLLIDFYYGKYFQNLKTERKIQYYNEIIFFKINLSHSLI